MARSRLQTVLIVFVTGIGLIVAFVIGLFMVMSLTAERLHDDAASIASRVAAEPDAKWSAAVEQGRQIMRAGAAEQNVPGLSVAVAVDGSIVWAEAFGWADMENGVAMTPDTRTRIGSASKALTSAAVGLLLEQGRLNLDERIQRYVPEFPEKPWPVTLRHLMAHTAGLRTDGGDEGPYGEHCDRAVEGFKLLDFANRDLLFEPGTRYRYSNFGWIVVSAAIEKVTGETTLDMMRRQVFEPLGLERTRAESATEEIADRAQFYYPRFAADPKYGPQLTREVDFSCYAGGLNVLSTPSDLARFVVALEAGKFLRPETVKLLQTSQRLSTGEETGYGLGWDLETRTLGGQQVQTIGYDGESLDGFVLSLMSFPDRKLVVALTSNMSWTDTPSLALKIAEAFAQQSKRENTPR